MSIEGLSQRGVLKVLHSFCASCGDGAGPSGRITYTGAASGAPYDGTSAIYGTTYSGGANGQGGTIFSVAPGSKRKKWNENILYSFCAQQGCADGEGAEGALLDSTGNLTGTTFRGGSGAEGTVFRLAPNGDETALYQFTSSCSGGCNPFDSIVGGARGVLFGVATDNDGVGGGDVFELQRDGTYTILHHFSRSGAVDDGCQATSGLSIGATGVLYGTTGFCGANNGGVVFSLKGTTEKILYNFCSAQNCTDGRSPQDSDLVLDQQGNLFGTTLQGGANGKGVVFEITP